MPKNKTPKLVKLDIPEGPERDSLIRALAATTTDEEAERLVEAVMDFHTKDGEA